MAIKRYQATKDNTITNALQGNLVSRGTGSNMGAADVLEVFSIYGQASASVGLSQELSRVLLEFPVDTILTDRSASVLPASGNVNFRLKLYNARHSETLPRQAIINISPISASWQEGRGLDMESYADTTRDSIVGSNWLNASSSPLVKWTRYGGDFVTASHHLPLSDGTTYSSYVKDITLEQGYEDIDVDITDLVESWLRYEHEETVNGIDTAIATRARQNVVNRAIKNYGVAIRLTSSQEARFLSTDLFAYAGPEIYNADGATKSFYTKKFFARSSEFFYKKPVIEAQWDDSLSDDSDNFFLSSSLADEENLNTIYFYNYIRGKLRNIPAIGTGKIGLTIHSGSADHKVYGGSIPIGSALHHNQHPTGSVKSEGHQLLTGSYVSTGIYSASFSYASSSVNRIFPVWRGLGNSGAQKFVSPDNVFFTGSVIEVKTHENYYTQPTDEYVIKITNLKPSYRRDEKPRLRLYSREKGWNPTVYTKASTDIENNLVERAYYKVFREVDGLTVINYGTGSAQNNYSKLSYDASGSYFNLDMSLMQGGYSYAIKILIDEDGYKKEQPEIFRFRVES